MVALATHSEEFERSIFSPRSITLLLVFSPCELNLFSICDDFLKNKQTFVVVILIFRIPRMTEDMARNALLAFVNSKCCYGNRAAGELVIQNLKQLTVYRYRLETFNESRLSEWTFEPSTNNLVDGPQNGASPRPWDIKVQSPPMFQEDTKKFRVPHSSLVKVTFSVNPKCSGCHGAGRMRCVTCSGARHRAKQQKRCQMCSGTGRKRCSTCSGRGNKTCTTCQGEKKLLHFIQLIITWKNNVHEFVSEFQLNFPRELLTFYDRLPPDLLPMWLQPFLDFPCSSAPTRVPVSSPLHLLPITKCRLLSCFEIFTH
uniref:Ssu-2 homolog n=1 Tax=Sphenodon punctatus TaxID=8508 RepID=A0A8D0GCG3_SPHPU